MADKQPRSGRLARSAIAGTAVARAGVASLGHRAKKLVPGLASDTDADTRHQAELGRILFTALNQLKGVALKASQLLGSEPGLLPEPLREQLARACYKATPLNRALVHKAMNRALGPDWDARFADFEPDAFAAASLGQVHRATAPDGRPLALKLQYPGIAATMKSDMQLLRGLLGAWQPVDARVLDPLLDEIERALAAELDYAREADELDWFAQHLTPTGLSDLPGLAVARPVREFCGPGLLAMERLPGLHLDEWLATDPSQQRRDAAGQLLFDTFMRMAFELGRLHADPHPGNVLFGGAGDPFVVGMLDFGCTKPLPAEFRTRLARAWNAQLHRAPRELLDAYRELGMMAPGLTLARFEAELYPVLAPLLEWQVAPFRAPVCDFAQRAPLPQAELDQQRVARAHLHGVPLELPFLDRAWLGLNQLLRRLGARVTTTNRWIKQ